MQRHFRKSVWLAVASLVILSLAAGTLLAHEGRPVGDYRFVVGWLEEPSYEGARNAVSVTITKVVDSESAEGDAQSSGGQQEESQHGEGDGHQHQRGSENTDSGSGGEHSDSRMVEKENTRTMAPKGAAKPLASVVGQHSETAVPVEGIEGSIQVEVAHVPTGAKRTMDLIAVFGEPGHYVAHLIPTASGVYEFRVFGAVEGVAIDETFASRGGGGGFDDIRTSAGLHFPEELPELREIESGVRGALATAQKAQDAALAAQQDGGGKTLAIVALIAGIAGVVFGIGGLFLGLRARQT